VTDTITVWITKYALTMGIYKVQGEVDEKYPDMLIVSGKVRDIYHNGHWHRTPEMAIAKAQKMRNAKIKSLRKMLDKLEAMTFEVYPDV